jgi:hypothetical protein
MVSMQGTSPVRRYLLAADDDSLLLLGLEGSADVRWALQVLAPQHPGVLTGTGSAELKRAPWTRIRIERGEVFVNKRNVGYVQDFIDVVPRREASVSPVREHYGVPIAIGVAIGLYFFVAVPLLNALGGG